MINYVLPILFAKINKYFKIRKNKKAILFSIHNRLCLESMMPLINHYSSEVDCVVSIAWVPFCKSNEADGNSSFPGLWINKFYAQLVSWDVIIFADHFASHFYDEASKKVMVQHGLGNSAPSGDGGGYSFSEKYVLGKSGRMLYDSIFIESDKIKNDVLKYNKNIFSRIKVIGDFRVDILREKIISRQEIRRSFLISPNDNVVIIGSAHGGESTWFKYYDTISNIVTHHRDSFKFILMAHPHIWSYNQNSEIAAKIRLLAGPGVQVVEDPSLYLDCIAASDFAVADYSSVTLFYLIAKIPTVFVPLREGVINHSSLTWEAYKSFPKLLDFDDFNSCIGYLKKLRNSPIFEKFDEEICSKKNALKTAVLHIDCLLSLPSGSE